MANKPTPAEKLPKIIRVSPQEQKDMRDKIWGNVEVRGKNNPPEK